MSIFKKLSEIAAAVTALFTVGCHPAPECYYGPPPVKDDDEVQNDDINPEVLNGDDNINKPVYRGNPAHSNEALDVYGPPPMDLDPVDINPEMLEEPEPEDQEFKDNTDATIDDYKNKTGRPEIVALYGVRMETVDK